MIENDGEPKNSGVLQICMWHIFFLDWWTHFSSVVASFNLMIRKQINRLKPLDREATNWQFCKYAQQMETFSHVILKLARYKFGEKNGQFGLGDIADWE